MGKDQTSIGGSGLRPCRLLRYQVHGPWGESNVYPDAWFEPGERVLIGRDPEEKPKPKKWEEEKKQGRNQGKTEAFLFFFILSQGRRKERSTEEGKHGKRTAFGGMGAARARRWRSGFLP